MVREAELSTGTLSAWDDERGFGFIAPGDGSRRVFAHISAFSGRSTRPVVGDTVTFRIELAPEGKFRAVDVRYRGASAASRPAMRRAGPRWGRFVVVLAFVALFVVVTFVWEPPVWIPVLYAGASLACIVAYAMDKSAAQSGGWRVSESTLLLLGLVGGWPGALIAQQILRHKTAKQSFRFAFWMSVVANIGMFLLVCSPEGARLLLRWVEGMAQVISAGAQ